MKTVGRQSTSWFRNTAPAKDEDHGRYDYKQRSRQKTARTRKAACTRTPVGRSASYWPLIIKSAWDHHEWEVTVQQWYNWQFEVKKKDEEKRMEVEHQKIVSRMIDSAQGGAGLLHKITEPTARRG